MQLTGIDLLFWAVGFLEHVLLLWVLWAHKRVARFPFFTALITSNVFRTISLFLVFHRGTKEEYLFAYLLFGAVDLVLQLCVVYEIASRVFRPLGKWASDARLGLIVLIGISVSVASALTWLSAPPGRSWMRMVLIKGNFFSSTLMTELFIGMMALSATIALPWKTHVARIAQGFGAYSIVGILTGAAHSHFGTACHVRISAILSHFRIAAYLLCLAYWIVMLWRDAPSTQALPEEALANLYTLQRKVEYSLQRLKARKIR